MRVTVSHKRPKEVIIQSIDRSFDDLFRGPGMMPVQIVNQQRRWSGPLMTFSFNAKAGLISVPIKGWVEVTDSDVTVDADFGLLERLCPGNQAREVIAERVRGWLK